MFPSFPNRQNFLDPPTLSDILFFILPFLAPVIMRKWPTIRAFLATRGNRIGSHMLIAWVTSMIFVFPLAYKFMGGFIGLPPEQAFWVIFYTTPVAFLGLAIKTAAGALRGTRATHRR